MGNEARVTDCTVGGRCSNCGGCCTDLLPISEEEKRRIKKYIGTHHIKAHTVAPSVMMEKLDMTCPFRNNAEQKCDIYEVRPQICRSFMCNYKMADILRNRKNFESRYLAVSMRDTFFGDSSNRRFVESAYQKMFQSMATQVQRVRRRARYGT